MQDPIDIVSDEAGNGFPEFDAEIGPPLFPEDETGDGIDSRLRPPPEEPPPPRDAKAGIPTIDEWLDFWSRIVLRVATDYYIDWAFRNVDENVLTEREISRIQMTEAERQRIAVPLAEISHKSKVMRKYGRTIVASGGVFDAIVSLGTWKSRVDRIARRYKKAQPIRGRVVTDERSGQSEPPEAPGFSGANGGSVGNGWTIVNPGG